MILVPGGRAQYVNQAVISFDLMIKVTALYGSNLRRQREAYLAHCLRMAESAAQYGCNDRIVLLCLLHDALEVGTCGLEELTAEFNLSDQEVEVMKIVTVGYGESSQDHFNRVLASNNCYAYIIKYFDNKDNAVFFPQDYAFTENVLKRNPANEIVKYEERVRLLKEKMISIGMEDFFK